MAIIIRRLEELKGKHDIHEYEIRINSDRITTFKHKHSDGLECCLMSAAKAVLLSNDEEEQCKQTIDINWKDILEDIC